MRTVTICLILIAYNLSAQKTDQEYHVAYKEAVQLFARQDFEGAVQKLNPLTGQLYNNAIVPYSLYYHALSSIKLENPAKSRAKLRDLMNRYPSWKNIDEAYYLYALANFKDAFYEEGLTYVERISHDELIEDQTALLETYISPLENVVILKDLNKKFPNQEIVAKALVNSIQAKSYSSQEDLELSDLLTNRFEFQNSTSGQSLEQALIRPYDDEIIDFGILLPFNLEQFDLEKATTDNRYVYDLYLGMQIASEKLQQVGIPIRLFGFDVDRRAESIQKYLVDDNFKKLDLLIGPLYGRPNRLIEDFASANKIYQVHPISNSRSLILDSPSRFLAQPSYETQAEKCLDFAETLEIEKSVSIYHGHARKDSLLANIYAEAAKKRGFIINECKRYWDETSVSPDQEVGHVFITGDANFGPEVLRGLGQSEIDSIILGTSTSFNYETDTQHMLSRNLFLVNTNYVDVERVNVRNFRKKFIAKMNMIPSYYAYLGYDMLLYFGHMLKDGKEIFRLNLNENPSFKELLLSGFNYSENSTENKIVPLVKFAHGRIEIVNGNE